VPLDETLLIELAENHSRFITLEEHSLAGGFGSAVVEVINDRGLRIPVERIGVPKRVRPACEPSGAARTVRPLGRERRSPRSSAVPVTDRLSKRRFARPGTSLGGSFPL